MKKQSKATKVDYESLGATYQVVEIALLNQVLKAHGIGSKSKRRKICEDFIFDLGVILDGGGFQTSPDSKWYGPVLCFTETDGNHEEGEFFRTKKLFKLSDDFPGYHEYAFGNLDYFFDEHKEKTPFDWGPEHE